MASPSTRGQATIRTATVASRGAPLRIQRPQVSAASRGTTGTNSPQIRSARRCKAAHAVRARSTSAAVRARWVSAPTRLARMARRPSRATHPLTTSSPGLASTGAGSPVIASVSTAQEPSTRPRRWRFSRQDAPRRGGEPLYGYVVLPAVAQDPGVGGGEVGETVSTGNLGCGLARVASVRSGDGRRRCEVGERCGVAPSGGRRWAVRVLRPSGSPAWSREYVIRRGGRTGRRG